MSRSPLDVLVVAGALSAVFTLLIVLLVAREERRVGVASPRVRKVREPRVRAVKEPPAVSRPEPPEVLAEPDPRRESLVLNLDAFTGARSQDRG